MKEFYTREEVKKILEAVCESLFEEKPWYVKEVEADDYEFCVTMQHNTKVDFRFGRAYLDDLFPEEIAQERVYKGKIRVGEYSDEAYNVVFVDGEPLAYSIKRDIGRLGKYLSVSYYISDVKPKNEEELREQFLRRIEGGAKAQYYAAYSDCTGYLYTTEELVVGGHDLLEELRSYEGKYVYLKVGYKKESR